MKHIALIALAVAGTLAFTGCSTINSVDPATLDLLATGAGEAAAATWVATAHPSTNQQENVRSVLVLTDLVASGLTNINTFASTVTPLVVSRVNASALPAADKPLVNEGITLLLVGADLYATAHTNTLQTYTDKARFLADFCWGAETILGASAPPAP